MSLSCENKSLASARNAADQMMANCTLKVFDEQNPVMRLVKTFYNGQKLILLLF